MKHSTRAALALIMIALFAQPALAQDAPRRKPVILPPDAKAIFLAQMLGHVVSLDGVVIALGRGDYGAAAEIAGTEMGETRFQEGGGEQSPNLGIGEHLPEEFRAIGKRFRAAANAFAELARGMPENPSADQQRALFAALGRITTECRVCHDSYRVE